MYWDLLKSVGDDKNLCRRVESSGDAGQMLLGGSQVEMQNEGKDVNLASLSSGRCD